MDALNHGGRGRSNGIPGRACTQKFDQHHARSTEGVVHDFLQMHG